MSGNAQRIILHVDMDSFYASVEMRERPELVGKPVVIGADPKGGKGRGVVATCSYEARAFGIRSAMPISQAYALCPHAIFLPPDFPSYVRESGKVMAILRSQAFKFQQVSIDEAFLDVSPVGSFCAADKFAQQIKNEIRTKLGLTCSIGVAPTKVVAKIASDYQKPDGLTVVEPAGVHEFLSPLPVRKIPGIGKKTEAELHKMGIKTIGKLGAYDVQALIAWFGRWGIAMHDLAFGIDKSEVEERVEAKSVSRETTFPEDTDNRQEIGATMDALAEDVHTSLVEEGLRFRTLTVKVRYQGFVTRTMARTLAHYTDDVVTIRACAHALLHELLNGRKIRLIGLRLSSFEEGGTRQITLDEVTGPDRRS